MENQISNGAMLGIVLLALAVVIGLGFSIFAIARGTANEGVADLQDSLGQVAESTFTDYDQRIVTGTQVLGAYNHLAGKPYAILISTTAYENNKGGAVDAGAPKVTVDGTTNKNYINYNALLNIGSDNPELENGYIIFNDGFKVDGGKVKFYNVTGNLSKSGMQEYVSSNSRFQAYVLKDESGTIIGVVFEQIVVK